MPLRRPHDRFDLQAGVDELLAERRGAVSACDSLKQRLFRGILQRDESSRNGGMRDAQFVGGSAQRRAPMQLENQAVVIPVVHLVHHRTASCTKKSSAVAKPARNLPRMEKSARVRVLRASPPAVASRLSASALLVMSVGCQSTASGVPVGTSPERSAALTIKGGQLLSVIGIDRKDGEAASAARRRYFGGAFPIARSFGLQSGVSFRVQRTLSGTFRPGAVALFLWPNQASEGRLTSHPKWPALKALRPDGWDELRIYSAVIDDDVQAPLDAKTAYAIGAYWPDARRLAAFERSMQRVRETIVSSGGRVVLTMNEPKQETHASSPQAPNQVLLMEWKDEASIDAFVQSTDAAVGSSDASTGVARFELHQLTLPGR